MKKQSKTILKLMKIFVLMTVIVVLSVSVSYAAPKVDKHQSKGVACSSCHEDGTDNVIPADATCIKCHGSYADLAQKTANLDNIKAGITNPHKSHIGEARCTVCHKNHAASVLYCNECHSPKFDMKVP